MAATPTSQEGEDFEIPALEWFGSDENWPLQPTGQRIEAPVGQTCLFCTKPIEAGQAGVVLPYLADTISRQPFHAECVIHMIGLESQG